MTRRGGTKSRARAAKQESQTPETGPAYITRRMPHYEPFSVEAVEQVEKTADGILAEIGVEFWDDPEALELWKAAGADVSGTRVRFERGLVRSIIQKTAPKVFTQHARNPANSVQFGGDAVVFVPAYGSPFVRDLEGGRRYSTLADFENLVKLAQSTPWLHHSGGTICEPVDVPVNKRHLDMVYTHLRYSDRPFLGSVTSGERAADSVDLARAVFGEDFVDKNCVIMGNINVNSPLVFDGVMTGALKAYARANQAAIVTPFILGGAMGPPTMPGAVAQSLAEGMAGAALTQLVRPGAPVIFGNFISSMSLKSGAPTFGTPESSLATFLIGQVARRLDVPFRTGGAYTASKIADYQAGRESGEGFLTGLLAGAHFILHTAGWLEGGLSMGYEKFMLDCDSAGMAHKFLAGLDADENALAFSAFREVGPGKHFLGSEHTMQNYRTAYYESTLADSSSFEQWRDAGEKDAVMRASARWKQVLNDYQAPPMDEAVDEALRDVIARKKASAPDAWY